MSEEFNVKSGVITLKVQVSDVFWLSAKSIHVAFQVWVPALIFEIVVRFVFPLETFNIDTLVMPSIAIEQFIFEDTISVDEKLKS